MGGIEVDVSVAQLAEHLCEHFEELFAVHGFVQAPAVGGSDGIPVQPDGFVLVVEEAVVLVDDGPESVKVPLRRIVEVGFLNASGQQQHEDALPGPSRE